MNSFTKIETERLLLDRFTSSYLTEKYVAWLNDQEVVKFSEQRHKSHTIESCRDYYESFSHNDNIFIAIVVRYPELRHIGNITVTVDTHNLVADIAIVIGEKSAWGKGYGKEAWMAIMNYLLVRGGIRKVTAGTMSINSPMLGVMSSSNMIIEGVRKGQFLVNGKVVNHVMAAAWPPLD